MDDEQIQDLFEKYRNGNLSEEEQALLEGWFAHFSDNDSISLSEEKIESELTELRASIPYIGKKHPFLKPRTYIAAASVALLILAGVRIFYYRPSSIPINTSRQTADDIRPGIQQATLTLADGQKIILKKGMSGFTATQGDATVNINDSAGVSYSSSDKNITAQYNVMTTSAGEQSPYPLILADGTKVWLDAESSISFPVAFSDKERVVEITGEAYFEVAHKAGLPFRIKVKGITIEDIGTKFNINAYDNEPGIKTTLIEGAVNVKYHNASAVLKPGQQATVQSDKTDIGVKQVNASEAVAWKDGTFVFDQTDLQSMMRQLARWYGLTIVYRGNISNDTFDGTVNKNLSLSDLLKVLQLNNVHYKITTEPGKKELIILP